MCESQAFQLWSPPESITIRLQLLLSRLCCKLPLRCLVWQGQILTLSESGDHNSGGASHRSFFPKRFVQESTWSRKELEGAGRSWKELEGAGRSCKELEAHASQKQMTMMTPSSTPPHRSNQTCCAGLDGLKGIQGFEGLDF